MSDSLDSLRQKKLKYENGFFSVTAIVAGQFPDIIIMILFSRSNLFGPVVKGMFSPECKAKLRSKTFSIIESKNFFCQHCS